ncbi:DeoR/GlpR transcriptional regulator [Aeromonas sobria]|jgi:DeoR family L-fucose operon activator|nr:DeoR/GlpR transcriptional regulator [Aeromonas sobria]
MLSPRVVDIEKYIVQAGSVTVKELSDRFSVSLETIRRDLQELESNGSVKRVHGGAISLDNADAGLAFNKRKHERSIEKKLIAYKALALIKPGDMIMLDASSTCWYLAEALPDISLTVITNSFRNVLSLAVKKNIKTIAIGGEYSEKYAAFVGTIASGNISQYRVDTLFLSCSAYSTTGVWENNEINASTKKVMLASAKQKVLLADSHKENRSGIVRICQFSDLDIILTEKTESNVRQLNRYNKK